MFQVNNLITILFLGGVDNCSLGNMFRDNHSFSRCSVDGDHSVCGDIISKSFVRVELPIPTAFGVWMCLE